MATPHDLDVTATRQAGRLSRALIRIWMKRARIVEVEPVAGSFRLITLESPAFRGLAWTPGQKVQIAMGSAFVARTFTPMQWDAATGRTRILGYAHGNGPGSAWIRAVNTDDECDVFGPRASLDLNRLTGSRILLGDETSIGLAYALSHQSLGNPPSCLLEVNSIADTREVLSRLDLSFAQLFERTINDTHLQDIEQRLPALAVAGASFVLTGKASSIQRLRRILKGSDIQGLRLMTKPYWALGKTGLD